MQLRVASAAPTVDNATWSCNELEPRLRAAILAPGSRGDVQPYVAIGQALKALGHDCTIVTTLDHQELVRAHGLDVATLPLNVAAELLRVETNRSIEGAGSSAHFGSSRRSPSAPPARWLELALRRLGGPTSS